MQTTVKFLGLRKLEIKSVFEQAIYSTRDIGKKSNRVVQTGQLLKGSRFLAAKVENGDSGIS